VSAVGIKERFLREERGFTLTEVLVTMIIMIAMLFALYSLFDMGLRIFSFGTNEVEATENARQGLERMERELRGAYKHNSSATPAQNHLFFNTASPTTPLTLSAGAPKTVNQITFGNDLGAQGAGNKIVECGAPCEYITYKLTDAAGDVPCDESPCTLRRVNTANSADDGDPLVENVITNGLTFTFYKSDGTSPATLTEGEIGKVLVSLDVAVNPGTEAQGTQELSTEIDLRNR
jgi:prepilin-type N-terminal cleavage/methylation domain-containing protein